MVIIIIGVLIREHQGKEYCINQGYDGYELECEGFKGRCFKIIPHKSGLGTTKGYTGCVDI